MRILLASTVAVLMLLQSVAAQNSAPTATQFYLDYRAAWANAKTMDALLPYIAKDSRSQFDATPKEQQQPMFELMKAMGKMTDLKVIKETKTRDGYLLEMTAVAPDHGPVTGTAEIIVEGGAMKLKTESWKG